MKNQLNSTGQEIFDRCQDELIDRGQWSEIYVPLLRTYAFCLQEINVLAQEIRTEGTITQHVNKAGHLNLIENPKVRTHRTFVELAIKLGKEFGLTPASRQKIKETAVRKEDPFKMI